MARTDGTEDGNGGSDKNNTNTGGGQHFRKPARPPPRPLSPVAEEDEAESLYDADDEYMAEGTGENLPEEDVCMEELSERTGNASPPPEPAVEEETAKRKFVVTTAEEVKMINEVNKKWREETGKFGWRYTEPDEGGRRKMYFVDLNPNKEGDGKNNKDPPTS